MKLQAVKELCRKIVRRSFSAKHIYLTNTVSCGVLLAAGDFIEQKVEKARSVATQYDISRTGRMFAVGLSQGPPHHYWYTWLDKVLPKRDLRTVGLKILADQIIAAPFFAVTFFFGMGLMQNKRPSECWQEFKNKFAAVYLFDWCIWPPTQFVNFLWIPAQYRVVYVNGITVIWDVFLSYMKHFDELKEEPKIKFE